MKIEIIDRQDQAHLGSKSLPIISLNLTSICYIFSMEVPYPHEVFWVDGADPNLFFDLAKETGKLSAWQFYFGDYGRGYEAWDSMFQLALICAKNFSSYHLKLKISKLDIAFAWLNPIKSRAYFTEQEVIRNRFQVGWKLLPRPVYLEAMLEKREEFIDLQSRILLLSQANDESFHENVKDPMPSTIEAEDIQVGNLLELDEVDDESISSENHTVNDLNPEIDLVKLLGSSKLNDDFEDSSAHDNEPRSRELLDTDFWDEY
jgi:hypothetical protein